MFLKFINKIPTWFERAKIVAFFKHPLSRQAQKKYRMELLKPRLVPNPKIQPIDHKKIPIYIIVYNQLKYLKQLVAFLENYGLKNIHFIDNASTYEPLLEYLSKTKYTVHRMDKNWGHNVFTESGYFDDVIRNQYYVLTDPDVMPDAGCPKDFLADFYEILHSYDSVNKVGCALARDNIAKRFEYVLKIENRYYLPECRLYHGSGLELYHAPIDTTFALYRPRSRIRGDIHFLHSGIRVAGKYTARHLPWHEAAQDDEMAQYIETSNASSTMARKTKGKK